MATEQLQRPRVALVGDRPVALVLRVVAVAGLGVSSYVHLHLAGRYTAVGGTLTQGDLFYAQGAAAAVLAAWLLVRGSRVAWAVATLLCLASVGAVLLYRYVDVGALGPIPNMYEPVWYAEKTASAIAEAAVPLLWAVSELARRSARGRRPAGW